MHFSIIPCLSRGVDLCFPPSILGVEKSLVHQAEVTTGSSAKHLLCQQTFLEPSFKDNFLYSWSPFFFCGFHKNKAAMHVSFVLAQFAARVHSGRNACIFFCSCPLFIRSDNTSSVRLGDLNGLVVCTGVPEQSLAQGALTTHRVVPAFLPKQAAVCAWGVDLQGRDTGVTKELLGW